MRNAPARLAALAVTASLALPGAFTGAASAAAARTPSHVHAARYVSLDDCGDPCGQWTVSMRDGSALRLPDARTHPLSKHGKPVKDRGAPIGVSGDGTRVAYVRARDGRVVVRDLRGGLFTMPADTGPARRVSDLRLSLDGASLAVVMADAPDRVYDVASARLVGTLPRGHHFVGFSGDGGEVLAAKGERHLYSFTRAGALLAHSAVPEDGPYALNADGRTVAFMKGHDKQRRVVLWDLATGKENVRVWVWMPRHQSYQMVEMLDWTANGQLSLHVEDDVMREPTRMSILLLDLATSRFTVRDRYTVRPKAWGFEACG